MTNKVNVMIYMFYINSLSPIILYFVLSKIFNKHKKPNRTSPAKWMLNQKIKQNEKKKENKTDGKVNDIVKTGHTKGSSHFA